MKNLQNSITMYLNYCQQQKRLDFKTIKAYRIDLNQFAAWCPMTDYTLISPEQLEIYISSLHNTYKPKTVKRKIASLKAYFHYLEYRNYIALNPFNKIQIKFREPVILPRTIPLHTIEKFLFTLYSQKKHAKTLYQKKCIIRDIAIIELLFASGMRISELCSLHPADIDLADGVILINGKGAKERRIQIGNEAVLHALYEYQTQCQNEIDECGYYFINRRKQRLSEQSVREMINKYAKTASIEMHITPHMFRHSFATYLLEADVDIRYIQEMLGHSSINITEIYTHVAMAKQRTILTTKHPRKNFNI